MPRRLIIKYIFTTFIALTILCAISCQSKNKTNNEMSKVSYSPEKFHNIKLGYAENQINECTPFYPEPIVSIWNKIAINMPNLISKPKGYIKEVIIPLCGVAVITDLQAYKYDSLSIMLIYYKNINEEKWTTIPAESNAQPSEHPASTPWSDKENKERVQKIEEAKKLSDKDLNNGTASEIYFNLDISEVINRSLNQGKYEFFVSMFGLESNHVQVEIIIED